MTFLRKTSATAPFVAAALAAMTLASAPAQAQFVCITNNGDCAEAEASFTWAFAAGVFTLTNVNATDQPFGGAIYFDVPDTVTVTLGSTSAGVSLSSPASPGDLPGGNGITPAFSADFSWERSGNAATGIGGGEFASFNLTNATLADFLSGAIRVGVHVQGLGLDNEGSESIVTVPEPETYALMLMGLGVLSFLGRRRRRS